MRVLMLLMSVIFVTACTQISDGDVSVDPVSDLEVSEPACQERKSAITKSEDGNVSFENVAFSFDRGQFSRTEYFVSSECILNSDDIKPDAIGARTVRFQLQYADSTEKADISVFKVQEYKDAFAKYPQYIENRDSDLRTLIANWRGKKTSGDKSPPHVRWMDAEETFYAKAAKVDFINGRGLLIVTQISQDAYINISNSRLAILFQGFTNDGEYFVEMNFPVKLKGLKETEDTFPSEHETEKLDFGSAEHQSAYEKYILETASRIDRAPPKDFKPELGQIEKFITGFEIRQ